MIPRDEYPRPQFVRDKWLNLNGEWEFEIDGANSGIARGLQNADKLNAKIIVPFCPESELSGVNNKDFMAAVWYRREIELPWNEGRTILHIGACDYRCEVFINGESVGSHLGGYVSFSFDITKKLKKGTNVIIINAQDDTRSMSTPTGKQSQQYHSYGCAYTRTTGIWQTVWLENVPEAYIKSTKYTTDINSNTLYIEAELVNAHGMSLSAKALFNGLPQGEATSVVDGNITKIAVSLKEKHLWEAGNGRLYDLELSLDNGDKVKSYFGLRSISYVDGKLLLNNKPVFQRLILDQGFYPDGIYTAATDEKLEGDIHLSMNMGFNGARLHQKIFEPRFLYHADKLGYLVWEEHANWGLDISTRAGIGNFIQEWTEAVVRDFNHPSIIGWCPFNETQLNTDPYVLYTSYKITKAIDPTRPVIDTSGWMHCQESDIYDVHDYDQNPVTFKERYAPLEMGKTVMSTYADRRVYGKEMTFVSEFGGIRWNPNSDEGWGYGNAPKTEEEFIARYDGLVTALLDNKNICAFCYTQLTDVEQEVNGLYTYNRVPKFDPAIIKAINIKKAAIEG